MSLTIIVLVSTVMASLIGLKIYFEYRQEKQLEESKHDLENDVKNAVHFVQEEVLAAHQPVAKEEPQEHTQNIDVVNPTYLDIENVNSAAALAENKPKPKKKKRYYGKQKPKIKSPKK